MINTRPYCHFGFAFHQAEPLCIFDYETGGLDANITQPLELAAVMVDPRKLEIIPDSTFHSFIKPFSDEEAIKKGLEPVQRSALAKNNINLEDLESCPSEKQVWEDFVQYQYRYNPKKDSWNAAVASGFNIDNFDMKIVNRLCEWYGPWDKKKCQQKIFNPIQTVDLKNLTWAINENNPEIDRNSMDALRKWRNMSTEHSHEALQDVLDTADILCSILKWFRHWGSRTDFKAKR